MKAKIRGFGRWVLMAFVLFRCASALATINLEGVRGFGVDTPGGRGGKILRVTNLQNHGEGSLRWALGQSGPRIVVFEVGGVIDLGQANIPVTEPFLTIAGQTAPSPGITLIRGGLNIRTHDVRVQHLRVRPGDAGQPARSGWAPDGIGISGKDAYRIHIDHCSTSWAVDENMSASGARTDGPDATSRQITISNSIIAEGLDYSTHRKGKHSKGLLVHDFVRDVAVVGNLFANNDRRNPYFKAHTTGVVVNNLIYNPGSAAIQLGYIEDEWRDVDAAPVNPRVAVVGNVLQYGRDTYSDLALVSYQGDVYLEDNLVWNLYGESMNIVQGDIRRLEEKPLWPEGLRTIPAEMLSRELLKTVGARPAQRDAVDQRIIAQIMAGQGRIIDSQDSVEGYPTQVPVFRSLAVPEDVDAWLSRLSRELLEQAEPIVRIPLDDSFNVQSAFNKARKTYPDIQVARVAPGQGTEVLRDVVYRRVGTRALHLDLFLPEGWQPASDRPAVLLVHGGGWRSGNRTLQEPMARYLANRGFVTATVEYRLSPEARYPAGVQDVKSALGWLRAQAGRYGIDPERVAVIGASSGAQIATLVGVTPGLPIFETVQSAGKDSVQAIVNLDGIVSFTTPMALQHEDDPRKNPSAAGAWFGGRYQNVPDLWHQASPLEYAGAGAPPTLFVNSSHPRFHAGRDQYIARLSEAGVVTEVMTHVDAPHPYWLFEPWFTPTAERVYGFLNRVMQ
ncbi:alpha/beta hydrolase fold domain-containing protein [Microbulbifer elongatus]|uniref:alpha/beta hydrolase fold domain-containing protein n=1 Tax=Microbulbifer elongatus TaxID=86173 RepID=UPI001E32D029|nr:alpha/beta hydrolase fold domain-containing protein [Microbulbifer elongatus]